MKNAVKYDVYLDILLVGSIYVTKSVFFKEHPKSPSSCKPHHPGLGTGMLVWVLLLAMPRHPQAHPVPTSYPQCGRDRTCVLRTCPKRSLGSGAETKSEVLHN